MAIPVLILGKSGSGKSASLRNFKQAGIINVLNKPLPFKNDFKIRPISDKHPGYAIGGLKLNYDTEN